jgi:hypothetical protein
VLTDQKQQVQEAVTQAAKQEGEKKATELVSGLIGGSNTDTTKTKTDSTAAPKDTQQKTVEEGVKTIQNLLKKKKN